MSGFEQKVKLDNLSAQYQSILGNIRIANDDLERLLADKEAKEAEIVLLVSTIETLTAELRALEKSIADKKRISEEKLADAETKRDLAATQQSEAEKKKTLLDEEIKELTQVAKQKTTDIAALTEEKEILEKSCELLTTQVAALSAQVEPLSTQINALRTELAELEAGMARVREAHDIEKTELVKEIEDLKAKKSEEDSKIVTYEEHVAKDKETMARRERDVLVRQKRLKDLFEAAQKN